MLDNKGSTAEQEWWYLLPDTVELRVATWLHIPGI